MILRGLLRWFGIASALKRVGIGAPKDLLEKSEHTLILKRKLFAGLIGKMRDTTFAKLDKTISAHMMHICGISCVAFYRASGATEFSVVRGITDFLGYKFSQGRDCFFQRAFDANNRIYSYG